MVICSKGTVKHEGSECISQMDGSDEMGILG